MATIEKGVLQEFASGDDIGTTALGTEPTEADCDRVAIFPLHQSSGNETCYPSCVVQIAKGTEVYPAVIPAIFPWDHPASLTVTTGQQKVLTDVDQTTGAATYTDEFQGFQAIWFNSREGVKFGAFGQLPLDQTILSAY